MNNKDLERMLYELGEINPLVPDNIVNNTIEKIKNDRLDVSISLIISIIFNLILHLAIIAIICILNINFMYKIYLLFYLNLLCNIPLLVVLKQKNIKNILKGCVIYGK